MTTIIENKPDFFTQVSEDIFCLPFVVDKEWFSETEHRVFRSTLSLKDCKDVHDRIVSFVDTLNLGNTSVDRLFTDWVRARMIEGSIVRVGKGEVNWKRS